MADAIYAARSATRDQTALVLSKIKLAKTENGRATQDGIHAWITNVRNAVGEVYNSIDPTHGMSGLLDAGTIMAAIRSTDHADRQKIFEDSVRLAAENNANQTDNRTDWTADFPSLTAGQDEANRINIGHQAAIGAKEAIRNAFVDQFGTDTTDPVLMQPGTDTPVGIDGFELHELIAIVKQGAERPQNVDILQQYCKLLGFTFDFRQLVKQNLQRLNTQATRVASNGVTFDDTHRAMVILANVEAASKTTWGEDFKQSLSTIRGRYAHAHTHDDASIKDVMVLLATADGARDLNDAPAPKSHAGKEFAHSVAETRSLLDNFFHELDDASDENSSATGTAAAVESDADNEEKRGRRKKKAAKKAARDPSSSRGRSRSADPKKRNPCKWCRKFKRPGNRQHPNVPESKCYWNRKHDVYRHPHVCTAMGIPFKPMDEFASDSEAETTDDD